MNIIGKVTILLLCICSLWGSPALAQKVGKDYKDKNSAVLYVEKTISLVSVDFKKTKYSSVENGYYKVYLPSGNYNLELAFKTNWRPGSTNTTYSSKNTVTIPFSAEKNKTSHLMNADVLSTSFRPRIKKGLPVAILLKKYKD